MRRSTSGPELWFGAPWSGWATGDVCVAAFRVWKEKETRRHNEYRTARLVLAARDRLTEDGSVARWSRG
jgi:hypothetical protein